MVPSVQTEEGRRIARGCLPLSHTAYNPTFIGVMLPGQEPFLMRIFSNIFLGSLVFVAIFLLKWKKTHFLHPNDS
jgi:hypothetical protein